ncbi:hypothetical protein [Treponema succinifaciens]|uniref:hypothetical protein n=1 Tax=Treponema succinifaciens TaxID=167 RepID=UPI003FCD70EC
MKTQATSKKNTARLTAALFALILLFPCCMDSGSGGSSDYDSGSNTENNGSQENPDDNDNIDDNTDNNGEDSGKTEPDEPQPDTPDKPEGATEIDSSTDMTKLNPAKTYIFKATNGTVDAAKLVYAKKILGENLFFTETNVNYILDFSNKSFADTGNEIENRNDFASTLANGVFTTNDYDKTITINGVTFITHPVAKEGIDNRIQQAFQFDKDVKKVSVTFGDKYNMTEAYKGGIILNGGDNTELTLNNFENTTLTGSILIESMGDFDVKTKKFKETTLISKLATGDTLPKTNNLFFGKVADSNSNFYGTGIDKIFENYCNKNNTDKLLVFSKNDNNTFDAKEYLNGDYMYDKNGNYNNNAYGVDINTALLMAEKLTREIENVNVSGSITSDKDTTLNPSNVRFSGDVSGLNFTATSGKGIIDFAKVGPKSEITAVGAKVIVRGLKEGSYKGGYTANTLDFSGVDKTLLKNIEVGNATKRVYGASSSNFSLVNNRDTVFKTTSSASTNQAWEKNGRGETVSDRDLISKLDVKAKADNPLLQKLLDENCPVYG